VCPPPRSQCCANAGQLEEVAAGLPAHQVPPAAAATAATATATAAAATATATAAAATATASPVRGGEDGQPDGLRPAGAGVAGTLMDVTVAAAPAAADCEAAAEAAAQMVAAISGALEETGA
jgi:hypothetical protein